MAAVVQEGGGSTSASLTTGITNEVKKTSTSSGLKSNVTSKSTGVRGASLTPIYNRLNETSLNRPMSANTFSDWSIEAGDTVTVKRDGNSYESQVHSTSLTWKGAPQIEMNSTGNEERDAVSKIKKQKYARGGVGSRIAGNQYNYEMNQEHLLYEVFNDQGKMSRFEVNLSGLRHEVMDEGGRVSELVHDVEGLHHTVSNAEGQISILENTAEGFRTRIAKVVDESGKVVSAEIVTAINNSGSSVTIKADKIYHLGETIEQKVTADYIHTRVSSINNLHVKTLTASGEIYALNKAGQSTSVREFYNSVTKSESGNNITLKFTRLNGKSYASDSVTFSRAVTSWGQSWSGGNFTVTAQPQNQSCWTSIVGGSESWSGRTVTIPIKAYNSKAPGTEVSTGYSVHATYYASKSDISMTRSGRYDNEPATDAALTNLTISSNGWYILTVSACGASKTFKIKISK